MNPTPTPESLRPTPGAVRAAELIAHPSVQPSVRAAIVASYAEIIDRETGVRELLARVLGLAEKWESEHPHHGDEATRAEADGYFSCAQELRAAIARCEGKDL